MEIKTPDWVKQAVFYQIFPDRFARGANTPHPVGLKLKPWGSPPEEQGYQGGDLYGIVEKLDYLQDLGVTALYLNPIFMSASNHRYHTYDYMKVDPLLGGDAALRALLDAAHARGMKVVLDGVFNHTGRGFWAFHHILENGSNSPYIDWFMVTGWPLRPYEHDEDKPHNYVAWWGLPALPKLNTNTPAVRDYIFEVAKYWLEFGIDGWRLDVPSEIDDDDFWREFRRVVKGVNPEAYIVGEIWTPAQRWLQGDQFDAVMNYLFTNAAVCYFAAETYPRTYRREHFGWQPLDGLGFGRAVDAMYGLYDWEINFAQWNMLDSHDTARVLWMMGEDKSAVKLAVLAQMTMPGAPMIYYGAEIGMTGADDPYCRAAFPWGDEGQWDMDLRAHYQRAIALRQAYPVLRTGSFESVYAKNGVYGFRRVLNGAEAVVLFNNAARDEPVSVWLGAGAQASYTDVWGGVGTVAPVGGLLNVTVPGRGVVVMVNGK